MATFMLAWELGGGLGHAVPLSQISRPLLDDGHRVHAVLRDLSTATAAFGDLARHPGLSLWQAPVWLSALRGLPESATYAELLFRAGFLDARRLLGLTLGWRSVLAALTPDLVIADHAPTLLLALRGLPILRTTIGTGFFQPPAVSPIPPFRVWDAIDPSRVVQSEARALATANAVLQSLGAAPLAKLHELLAVDENFLLTWREVDHYAQRAADLGQHYWGPLPTAMHGVDPVWPEGDLPRVFAYLKGEYGAVDSLVAALAKAPFRTCAFIPGLAPELALKHTTPRLSFVTAPVNMAQVCRTADAVLCNAGSGTVCTVLRAGIPVVMLPMHAEQLLFARRVAEAGAGLYLTEADARQRGVPALQRLLGERVYREGARALAERYSIDGARDVAKAVAARCISLVTTGAASTREPGHPLPP
ncbi:MAG: glycosyltransferase [Burkholderiales bacterium]